MESVRIYQGLKNLGFKGGEEIEIVKGMDFERKPVKGTVRKEYPKFLVIDVEFPGDCGTNYVPKGVNKSSMLDGDVLIRRVSDGVLLTGDEVGKFREVRKITAKDIERAWGKRLLKLLWG